MRTTRTWLKIEPLESRCLLSYTLTDLGDLGFPPGQAMSVNSLGQAAGRSQVGEDSADHHAFRYDPGVGIIDIGNTRNARSWAFGINDSGEVAGWYNTPQFRRHAFRTRPNERIN